MKRLLFLAAAALSLGGCASIKSAEYRHGYKDCAGKVSGVFEYIELLEREQDHCFKKSYYEDQIGNLQMENAALRAANEFLNSQAKKER